MSANPDRLFDLLPQIIQIRDAEQDWPLRALLRVIAQQVQIVEDDITLLYENWFIETCQDWVVPYIGALVGYEPVQDTAATRSQVRDKVLIPRREVANTIRYRRRKGTLALLEALGRDVSGWPAVVAVEFYKRLADFENLRYPDGSIDLLDLGKNNLPGALGPGFDTSPLSLQIHQSELGDAIGSLGGRTFRLAAADVSGIRLSRAAHGRKPARILQLQRAGQRHTALYACCGRF
jgi:hypothetical protein